MADQEDRSIANVSDVEREMARCLTGDTEAVVKVCTDIVSWTGPRSGDRPSWSNPGRNLSLQTFIGDSPSTSRLRYTPALEQTVDIVHIFLDLIVGYMNRMPNVTEAFSQSEMAIPSRRLSLSALVWMLWTRIKFINHQFCQETLRRIDARKEWCEKWVQTHETSLMVCETCQTSQEMISALTELVESFCSECKIKNTIITKTRKEMETEIYYITQWGAMRKWCSAIMHDMEAVAVAVKEMRNQSLKLGNQLRSFRTESMMTVSRLKDLSKEKEELIMTTEKAVESRASSIMKVNELNKKCRAKTAECDDWKKKFLDLEASTMDLKNEVRDLKHVIVKEREKSVNMSQEVQRKSLMIEESRDEISRMKKEFSSLTYSLKDDIASRDLKISNQLDKMKFLETRLKDSENAADELRKELLKEQAHGQEIWKSFEELKMEKQVQDQQMEKNYAEMDEMLQRLNDVEKTILAMPKYQVQVTGDPVQDMVCEKSKNLVTIRHLRTQNNGLSRTLAKMCAASDKGRQFGQESDEYMTD